MEQVETRCSMGCNENLNYNNESNIENVETISCIDEVSELTSYAAETNHNKNNANKESLHWNHVAHNSVGGSDKNFTGDAFHENFVEDDNQINMMKLLKYNSLCNSDSNINKLYNESLTPNINGLQRRVKSDLNIRILSKPPKPPVTSTTSSNIPNGILKNCNTEKRGSLDSNRPNSVNNALEKLKKNASNYTLYSTSDKKSLEISNDRRNDNVKISFPDNDRLKIKSINLSPRRSTVVENNNNEKYDIEKECFTTKHEKEKYKNMLHISNENNNNNISRDDNKSGIIEITELRRDLERIRNKLLLYEKKHEFETQVGCDSIDNDEEAIDKSDNINDNIGGEGIILPQPFGIKLQDLTPQQRANRNRVLINIGGIRHETYRSTLKNIPDTRLSWIAEESAIHSPEYDPITGEFFFDRHPQVFSHVLNYYRTGNLHVPYDVCGPLYEEELQYWGIDDSQVESCCWLTYRQHRDAQETLKEFEGIEFEKDFDDDSEPDLTKYGFTVDDSEAAGDDLTWYQKWQPLIWNFLEDPYSSNHAKIFAYISMSLIMVSVMLFCLETMTFFSNKDAKLIFQALDGCCVSFFTIELILRFSFCPEKILFLKGVMNWIDFLAILPFFINLILKNDIDFMQSVRVIRVFRIIKLSKHSVGLQILGHTLKASFRELLLLIFFLVIGIVIFSSLVYYCERSVEKTEFTSIPTTFWWAVITMTTVGYGDMVPTTVLGKIIGGLCSVSGVLMIALPVPVIVNNFNLYYSHAQARLKLPKKKRRMLCGAANALKGPAMEEFERRDDEDEDEEGSNENLPRINMPRASINSLRSLKSNGSIDNNSENNLAALRMKKFARRDSNMFSATQSAANSTATIKNGDLSPNLTNRANYASHKRRSLLPTMSSLPEIEH